jgi:hypothetical protein
VIRIEASPRPRVRVIGSLDGRAVRTLFDVISNGEVVLDLSEVNEAKESAVTFLARLPRERCRLAACPRWLSWWLRRGRRPQGAER